MSKQMTPAKVIATQVPNQGVREWDMAPESWDFEIANSTLVGNDRLMTLVKEFYKGLAQELVIYPDVTGVIGRAVIEGQNYVLAVTNWSGVGMIRGTLQRF